MPQKNCKEIYDRDGLTQSGLYAVQPNDNGGEFIVYCDMNLHGGQWTVIQRRTGDSLNFERPWDCYRNGFGDLTGNFWLGLEKIKRLTQYCGSIDGSTELYIGLEDHFGLTTFAHYRKFKLGTELEKYMIIVNGYNGTAGDSLSSHSGENFSTLDQDNDVSDRHCARDFRGGWWYNENCYDSNLNGKYYTADQNIQHARSKDGIVWQTWRQDTYSLKSVIIAIKPSH